MLERAIQKEYRTWSLDNRRWAAYAPRDDDIVIATAPKCGTTWMQQIVVSLVFQDAVARPLPAISPWIEARFRHDEASLRNMLEAQTHRRALKTHLPLDGLPLYRQVRYIHVARDGRDAMMSGHNHLTQFTPSALEHFDRIGFEDDAIRQAYPRPAADPAAFRRQWLAGAWGPSFFQLEASYWAERKRPNLLLVHFNDLKTDLDGEMRRISSFLDIAVDETRWPSLVEAAEFASMRRAGAELMPQIKAMFVEGAAGFFYRGANGRWRDVLSKDDVDLYDRTARTLCSRELLNWLERGRLGSGDPRDA
jgi:aryl sulfotransferase